MREGIIFYHLALRVFPAETWLTVYRRLRVSYICKVYVIVFSFLKCVT